MKTNNLLIAKLFPIHSSLRLVLVLCIGLTHCQTKQNTAAEQSVVLPTVSNDSAVSQNLQTVDNAPDSLTITVIPAPENTFGYNVLSRGKVLVHQPHIPGLPGIKGFATAEKARKTAELVQYKLAHHQMPPTVSPAELDSLGVLK